VETEDLDEVALLVAGPFDHDVAVIRGLHDRGQSPALLGAVAAGIPAFGQELREAAEGVLTPVQWWPSSQTPNVGPSGTDFVTKYQHRTGRKPSYPAAQAAAAGYLAHAAHRLDLGVNDLPQWTTSTLLGDFTLDPAWRQVGHHITTIRWQRGRPRAGSTGSFVRSLRDIRRQVIAHPTVSPDQIAAICCAIEELLTGLLAPRRLRPGP
jgi:ABC-type branched-subunit amino acid transport system substrate-binding protein